MKPAVSNEQMDNAFKRLENIVMPRFSFEDLKNLYLHLLGNSDLSSESILHEIENAAGTVGIYDEFYHSLTIEDISFLISHNRYQEKDSHLTGAGGYTDIQVEGESGSRRLFLISKDHDLIKKTETKIQRLIKSSPESSFRLTAFEIANIKKKDLRRLYILSSSSDHVKSSDEVIKGSSYIREHLHGAGMTEGAIRSFIDSSSALFVSSLADSHCDSSVSLCLQNWPAFRDMARKGDDIYIPEIVLSGEESNAEKMISLWVSREKIQENYETINTILERRGISFRRQIVDFFNIDGKEYAALTTVVSSASLSCDEGDFLRNEIYNRLLLLKSSPVPVGMVKSILDTVKTAKEYQKLQLIENMQKNKQREYLVPLVLLLNDENIEIRCKAFGLIKHYLFNPTPEMKNDYYWSTLKNIFSAATVPIDREKDRPSRPLSDDEIIRLITFRDIFYEEYVEPVTNGTYLFIRISGEGIGKGGIRAHAHHVTFSGEGALATNMLFKTLGLGIPKYTIGKGGILGDIHFKDLDATVRSQSRQNILDAYADFLYYKAQVGPLSDVPAGDVGVGGDEIGIIFSRITSNAFHDIQRLQKGSISKDSLQARILREHFGVAVNDADLIRELSQRKDLVECYTASAITGKPGSKGLALRSGATGRGLVEVLAAQQNYHEFNDETLWSDSSRVAEAISRDDEFLHKSAEKIKMLTVAIQGFGKVGASMGMLLNGIGSKIKMISDISGTIMFEQGIPGVDRIYDFCKSGNSRLSDLPLDILDQVEFIPGNTVLPLGALANVIVPSALEDVITVTESDDGQHLNARSFEGDYLLQGANGPATSEAEDLLSENGKISFPDILANSGGVLASYLEWLNGLIQQFGYAVLFEQGFVHPIAHNLICHYHPEALQKNLKAVDENAYDYAFKFILRHSTVTTISLSRSYKISLRTAYIALGIRHAADECRLTDQFSININRMRDSFATAGSSASS